MHRSTIVRSCTLAAVTAVALLVTPVTSSAQQRAISSVATPVATPASTQIGPVVAPVGVVRAETAARTMELSNPGPGNRNVIWMIVGGGMLVGGSIIGDDVGSIVSVTGLVIGLVGLYRFLQ